MCMMCMYIRTFWFSRILVLYNPQFLNCTKFFESFPKIVFSDIPPTQNKQPWVRRVIVILFFWMPASFRIAGTVCSFLLSGVPFKKASFVICHFCLSIVHNLIGGGVVSKCHDRSHFDWFLINNFYKKN